MYSIELGLILIHLCIGVCCFVLPILIKPFVLLLTAIALAYTIQRRNQHHFVLLFCGYLVGASVLLRTAGGLVFYEQVKYTVILFLVLGMLFKPISTQSLWYIVYMLLLVPGVFVAAQTLEFDTDMRKEIAFNLSGPILLGISAMYCIDRKISLLQVRQLLFYTLLPILATGVYLFLYAPDSSIVLSSTSSSFQTSGGFGPNQVSTILGLGSFICLTRFILYSDTLKWKIINGILFIFLTYRGLITLSRGGIFTAAVMILLFMGILFYYVKPQIKRRLIRTFAVFGGILILAFVYANIITNGFVQKRYNNEDVRGRAKGDITTGRVAIAETDLEAFTEHPFLGVGVGRGKGLREEIYNTAVASHNEVTRLLGEHGLFGLLALLIIFILPLSRFLGGKKNIYLLSFFAFWFLTINHAAMRIAAPGFIYGLSLLNITNEKNTVHRKQTGN
ncbi:O-antigen ligase family protein [Zhouia sp. PK063]|uniref:O-antigen ligase family protein n=1 Tax=Zhouia sp. PK063 TaxID=3373602 RepID=UPI0037AC10F4